MSEIGKGAETGCETGKSEARAVRQARLSAEMRENLKRRKAQARGRSGTRVKFASADKQSG